MQLVLRKDILIVIGVLIAAWFIKVVGVFIYLTYSKRREDDAQQAAPRQQQRPNPRAPPKLASTPAHIVAGLPVMTYDSMTTNSSSSSSSSSSRGVTPDQQQGLPDSGSRLAWRRSTELQAPGAPSQQQQQQQQGVAESRLSRFTLRLSLDSALRKQRQGTAAAAPASSSCCCPAANAAAAAPASPSAAAAAAAEGGEEEGDTCAICFCDFEGPQWVKQLPCGHYYHTDCIDTWLAKGTTCPLCKRPVWEETSQPEPEQEQQQQPEGQGAGQGSSGAGVQEEQLPDEAGLEGQVVVVVVDDDAGHAAGTAAVANAAGVAAATTGAAAGQPAEAAPAGVAAAAAAAPDGRHVVVTVQRE